ncbi:hypothetical protein F5Y08DRAFT_336481 [Xylaria arbuscula]|nr:hypothetical protein F5Y08DRAFT_336481 [Xylaria arbuscula]
MDLHDGLSKETSRILRKSERPYITSLKPSSMESRRRPLRTYGRHASSAESSEPTPKRQRLASSSVPFARDSDTKPVLLAPKQSDPAASSQSLSSSLPPLPSKKGTITAYFAKVIPQLPVIAPSSDPSSDPPSESNEPISTPPSSPPTVSDTRKRKARRLQTRVSRRRLDEEEAPYERQGNQDGDELIEATSDTERPIDTRTAELSEATPNALNRNQGVAKAGLEGSKLQENKRREKKSASVQTTLSLSMRESHYTECKECGMLYNHLHESDVKYHARRHASLRRAKARARTKSEAIE